MVCSTRHIPGSRAAHAITKIGIEIGISTSTFLPNSHIMKSSLVQL